jgi:hypothetical protein
MANTWIEFIKVWAKKNNKSYGCAISDPQLKIDYRKAYPSKQQQKERQSAEREKMGMEDMDAPEEEIIIEPVKKKGKKKSTKKLEAKEMEMMGMEDRDAPEKKQKKGISSEKVLTNANLVQYIKSFTPEKITKQQLEKYSEDIRNGIDYWGRMLETIQLMDLNKNKNKKQKDKILKELDENIELIFAMYGLSTQRLEYLAKKSKLKFDDEATYYPIEELESSDFYYKFDIGYDGEVGKDTSDNIGEALVYSFKNYKELMEEMGVLQRDAVIILNKRLTNKGIKTQFKEPK